MGSDKKKNIIIAVLLLVILFLIGMLFGAVLKGTKNENPPVENTTEEEPTTDEILSSLVGEWGHCKGEYNCDGIIVSKNNDKYTYAQYIMWSEGTPAGEIQNINKTDNKKYELTVYYAGYEDVESSAPERTEKYNINITDLPLEILYVNDNKYQKVTGDRETFFNNLMK